MPFCDTETRIVHEVKECYVILHPTFLDYKNVSEYSDESESDGIRKEFKSNYRTCFLKRNISNVGMYYDNKSDLWYVEIEFTGVSDSKGWGFKSPKDANEVYKQLREYFIS